MIEYQSSYNIGGSMEAFDAAEALFEDAWNSGSQLSGVLLVMTMEGKLTYQLFYDNTPLLNGNTDEAAAIITSAT